MSVVNRISMRIDDLDIAIIIEGWRWTLRWSDKKLTSKRTQSSWNRSNQSRRKKHNFTGRQSREILQERSAEAVGDGALVTDWPFKIRRSHGTLLSAQQLLLYIQCSSDVSSGGESIKSRNSWTARAGFFYIYLRKSPHFSGIPKSCKWWTVPSSTARKGEKMEEKTIKERSDSTE